MAARRGAGSAQPPEKSLSRRFGGPDMNEKSWLWDLLLLLVASPVLLIRAFIRGVRRLRLLRMALRAFIICKTCGSQIPLVGFSRCGCGYTYQGHLLRFCPVCGSFPNMIRCYQCRATEKVRQ